MTQTVKIARNNMRRIAYRVGAHGRSYGVFTHMTDRRSVPPLARYTTRAGADGVVMVPWKHPLYWNPDGSRIPDEF